MLTDSRSISFDTPDFSMPLSSSQQGHSGMFMVNPTFPVFGKICVPRRKIAAHAYPCELYAAHPKQSIGHSINNFTFKQRPPATSPESRPPRRTSLRAVRRWHRTQPDQIAPVALEDYLHALGQTLQRDFLLQEVELVVRDAAISGFVQNPVKDQLTPAGSYHYT